MALIADAPLTRQDLAHAPAERGSLTRSSTSLIFSDMVHRIIWWREYRRTLNELEGLSDRDLHDLALSRSDLKRVAREAAGY